VISIKKAGQYEIPAYQKDGNIRRLTMSGAVSEAESRRKSRADSIKSFSTCC
jgi:hypothetical protein